MRTAGVGCSGARARKRRRPSARLAGISLVALGLVLGPAAQGTSAGSSDPLDRAAVTAYLQARYALERAMLANAPATLAAAKDFADSLARECPGVLAHAPSGETALGTSRRPTARERGEAARVSRQLISLRFELASDMYSATPAVDREALASFAASVSALRWSDPRVAAELIDEARAAVPEPASNPGGICADASAWVQSGYRQIRPASKQPEARLLEKLTAGLGPGAAVGELFKSNETQASRAEVRRIEALGPANAAADEAVQAQLIRGQSVLGLPSEGILAPNRTPSTTVGTLLADGGGFFKVAVQPGPRFLGCREMVEVEYTSGDAIPSGGIVTSGGATMCLPHGQLGRTSPVSCEHGLIEVIVRTGAAVRRVRLLLSNGRTLTSPVVRVPRRYGGPAGIYAQGVAGARPYPLSIAELDARGRVVRTVRLPAVRDCRERSLATSRDRVSALARGTVPSGKSFTITAVKTPVVPGPPGRHRSARLPRVLLIVSGPATLEGDGGLEGGGLLEAAGEFKARLHRGAPLEPSVEVTCPPHESAIVFGLLRARGDSVLARTPAGLVPLRKVSLPARLHEPASLVYGAFPQLPEEVIVRRPSGTHAFAQSLRGRASEHREYCEGLAE